MEHDIVWYNISEYDMNILYHVIHDNVLKYNILYRSLSLSLYIYITCYSNLCSHTQALLKRWRWAPESLLWGGGGHHHLYWEDGGGHPHLFREGGGTLKAYIRKAIGTRIYIYIYTLCIYIYILVRVAVAPEFTVVLEINGFCEYVYKIAL